MPKTDEGAALGHASFWDERYAKATGDDDAGAKPTHEWFRDFHSLEPFFRRHLFGVRPAESRPRILHLGSGDSVEGPLSLSLSSTSLAV